MVFCEKCGKELGEGHQGGFCPQCGSALPAKAARQKPVFQLKKPLLLLSAVLLLGALGLWTAGGTGRAGKVQKSGRFTYDTELTEIVIPQGVTQIDSYAFAGCANLKSVIIPDSVKVIGEYAFNGWLDLIRPDGEIIDYDSDVTWRRER